MNKNRSSISKAQSYKKIGEFWDTHDLADYWDKTKPVEFDVDIKSEVTYYALDNALSTRVRAIARERGVSSETLLNLWVQEKLQEQEGQLIYPTSNMKSGIKVQEKEMVMEAFFARLKEAFDRISSLTSQQKKCKELDKLKLEISNDINAIMKRYIK